MDSLYQHDSAGRLKSLHHLKGVAELRQSYGYSVNALGNRTQAREVTPRTSGATATDMTHTYPAIVYRGDWKDIAGFHEASVHDASMSILFYGTTAKLRMGAGPDYSLYDVYIDGTLWLSFDGYAATEIPDTNPVEHIISVEGTGLHLLEVRNRLEKRIGSTGYKLRFHSLYAQPAFDVTTIDYSYDGLSRLIAADYSVGSDYIYGYDVAGNLINNNGVTRTYNAANQMTNDGTNSLTYDNNGNLTNDGVNSYTWDRANRMLTAPGSTSYKYDGVGNRIKQNTLQYLLDVQPGLTVVLSDSNNNRYIHGVRGIHAQKDSSSNWEYMTQDGLGSVRGIVDVNNAVIESRAYDPIGNLRSGAVAQSPIGFTGEFTEGDLVYLRARYMKPSIGTFLSLDPMELPNRYSYVSGDPINMVDPTGLFNVSTCRVEVGDDAVGELL